MKEVTGLITRAVFLLAVIAFVITSIVFTFKYSDSASITVGLTAIAGWLGLGAMLNLVCDVIPEIMDEITAR